MTDTSARTTSAGGETDATPDAIDARLLAPARTAEPDLADFVTIVERTTDRADYPFASDVSHNVVVYDADHLRTTLQGADPLEQTRAVLDELERVFRTGPGIAVFRGAFTTDQTGRISEVFREIITEERETITGKGDHFAKPGANDRVWNALEKLALRDPDGFVDYYSNDMLALASAAWLGPDYQVTSQVNVVNPGGEAQQPHRDYHLGFMTSEQAARFPRTAQELSPMLTLQGAVAHCDMPVETGPTLYLPYSHRYPLGYLAWRRPEFIDYFDHHRQQLPLTDGDAIFFNPAVFHAAGSNVTATVRRMANLLQISSAMGRALEYVNRRAMCVALYPAIRRAITSGMGTADIERVIAASAEGYPFPTDLDRDQPVGGLVPPSQADLVRQAVREGWDAPHLSTALADHAAVRGA